MHRNVLEIMKYPNGNMHRFCMIDASSKISNESILFLYEIQINSVTILINVIGNRLVYKEVRISCIYFSYLAERAH